MAHRVYLGRHGSQESRDEYDRVIGEWIASGRQSYVPTPDGSAPAARKVSEVIASFWEHAKTYYRNPDGTAAGELENYRLALRPLKRLYGWKDATDFGPLAINHSWPAWSSRDGAASASTGRPHA